MAPTDTEPGDLPPLDHDDDHADRPPYLEAFTEEGDAPGGPHRWHVIGNGRTIAGTTEGYASPAGAHHAARLTLAALLRHPGTITTLADYLTELDPTSTAAAELAAALAAHPAGDDR